MSNNHIISDVLTERFDFLDDSQQENVIFSLSGEEVKYLKDCNCKAFSTYRYEELLCMLMNSLIAFDAVVYKYSDLNRFGFTNQQSVFEKTIEINQVALNYFSVLQMFFDFIGKKEKQKMGIDDLYDSIEFSQCKVLRNYIQHVECLPITINSQSHLGDSKTVLIAERFFVPTNNIKIDRLRPNTKTVFQKIFGLTKRIDLYQIIQQSTDTVWAIQKKIREAVDKEYLPSADFIMKTYECLGNKERIMCRHVAGAVSNLEPAPFVASKCVEEIRRIRKKYPCDGKISDKYTINAPDGYIRKCQDAIIRTGNGQTSLTLGGKASV